MAIMEMLGISMSNAAISIVFPILNVQGQGHDTRMTDSVI